MDVARLRRNFAHVAEHGDEVPLFFYSDLFIKHPEVRGLFPVSMEAQRSHLLNALAEIVSSLDSTDDLTVFLQGLGRDHRKFGAVAEHYEAAGASLLATLEYFSGPEWTPELKSDWAAAYETAFSVMRTATQEDEALRPAWWRGTVVSHERRSFDVSVLYVQPEPAMDYLAGQSVAIECPSRPRLWRYYSMASAPRRDALLEFHVRLIDGGAVSMALTSHAVAGCELRLGPPVGALTLREPAPDRNLLLIAGSTGLAPLKAIADQLTALPHPPKVHLFIGARKAEDLYDLDSLDKMAAQHEWLTVTPVVSADPRFAGETGSLPDAVTRHGNWSGHDAYIAGPSQMVHDTAARLAATGMAADQIHIEDFGWSEP
ncbi:MAG TPA: globin domain-containing protein [Streptosporangiaceae bacterium]|nr:globin domain-containing protein [Streptosporangiaceae bacterium]